MAGVFTLIRGGVGALVRPYLHYVGMIAVSAVVALIALVYGLSALHRLVSEAYGAVDADLIFAGAFLLLALILAGAALAMKRRRLRDRAVEAATERLLNKPVPVTARRLRPVLRPAFFGGVLLAGAAAARALALRR